MDLLFSKYNILIMTTAGPLDGVTILRFAHAYGSGGGTERYLDDLNRALLARNAMTIVQIQLSHASVPADRRIYWSRSVDLFVIANLPAKRSRITLRWTDFGLLAEAII